MVIDDEKWGLLVRTALYNASSSFHLFGMIGEYFNLMEYYF